MFGEFQHRFSILAPAESRKAQPVLDEKKVRNRVDKTVSNLWWKAK